MCDLRHNLGKYIARDAQLPNNGLTLHDIGELIRRAGLAEGFIVETEYKVEMQKGKGKIDWVWLSPHTLKPIVAIEIEGRDVPRKSIERDMDKFASCNANINIIALFQIDHNRTPKRGSTRNLSRVQELLKNQSKNQMISVILDSELMQNEGIEKLQTRAKSCLH